jgi:opacity protein-like surface antigen
MQTRKALMLSAAAAALTMAAPSAQAANSYVSLFGGASLLDKPGLSGSSHTHTTTTLFFSSSQSVDTSFKTGFVFGGNWGVDWGTFRTELETAYRTQKSGKTAHLKTSYSVNGYAFDGTTYSSTSRDETVPANLRLSAWSLMANAWYDFHGVLPYNITPYVGGGIGGALVKIAGNLDHIKLNEKNSFVFAYQFGAGMSVPVSQSMKMFLDYRYFRADSAALKLSPGFHGGDVSADFNSHSVLLGLRIDL